MKRIMIYSFLAFILSGAFTVPDVISQITYGMIGGLACAFFLFLTFKWRPVKEAEKVVQHIVACLITYAVIVSFYLVFFIWNAISRQTS